TSSDGGMRCTEYELTDLQSALQAKTRFLQITLTVQQYAKVICVMANHEIVGAQRLLIDGQRTLEVATGLRILALIRVDTREIHETGRRGSVVGTVHLLHHHHSALEYSPRLGELSSRLQVAPDLVQQVCGGFRGQPKFARAVSCGQRVGQQLRA